MTQLPLPGFPLSEAKPTEEETATTVLIFDDDDKVQERVVNALRNLFYSNAKPGHLGEIPKNNCKAFLHRLMSQADSGLPTTLEFEIRRIVQQELHADMSKARKKIDRTVGVRKRPSK
jgi:hypothetical protein